MLTSFVGDFLHAACFPFGLAGLTITGSRVCAEYRQCLRAIVSGDTSLQTANSVVIINIASLCLLLLDGATETTRM